MMFLFAIVLLLYHHVSSLTSPLLNKDGQALHAHKYGASGHYGPALAHLNAQGHVDLQHSEFVSSASLIRMEVSKTAEPRPISPTQKQTDLALVDERHTAAKAIARDEDNPLPPWAQVVLGITTMLVIAGILTYVKARCTEPVPRNANSSRLEVVLAETLDKVEILKGQLDERYAILDAAAQFDDDPETAAAKQRERETQEQQYARARECHQAAEKVAEQKEALLGKATDLQNSFTEAIGDVRERVEDFARQEANGLYGKMTEAVSERTIPSWAPPEWMTADDDDSPLAIPPVTQLVAGAFAPSRLRWLRYSNGWTQLTSLILAITAVIMFLLDRRKHCKDQMVWIWQYGLFALATLDIFTRAIIMVWCTIELDRLQLKREEEEKMEAEALTGVAFFDMFARLRSGGLSFFEAYFRLHSVVDSWVYAFTQFLSFVSLFWGGFGLYITIDDIILDTLACDAKHALTFQHCYSCFYVVWMTWNILGVLLWITNSISTSSRVSMALIKAAKHADESLFHNIPVCLSFVQSYVLQNSSEALGLTERQVKDELRSLSLRLRDVDEKLRLRQRVSERLKQMQAAGGSSEAEFMERCETRVSTALEQAKPLVGLIAANVSSKPTNQPQSDFHGYSSQIEDQKGKAQAVDRASPYGDSVQGAHDEIEDDVEGF